MLMGQVASRRCTSNGQGSCLTRIPVLQKLDRASRGWSHLRALLVSVLDVGEGVLAVAGGRGVGPGHGAST